MKVFFRNIHLYLGLAAGLIVMTTCFTGAVLVFEEDLTHVFNKERYYVKSVSERLPVHVLVNNFNEKVKGASIVGVKVYNDPNRTVEINYTENKGGKRNKKPVDQGQSRGSNEKGNKPTVKPGGGEARQVAFMNPYTGDLIALYNYRESFYYTMFSLHRWLLSGDTGKMIVGVSTLIFLFILITGIILWWPKNRRMLAQRLSIKRNSGWKRLNHDFHIVLGFYSAIFLFIFAFTGLAWSFEWFNKGIYTVTNSSMQRPEAPRSALITTVNKPTIDQIVSEAMTISNDALYYNIGLPKDSAASFTVSLLSSAAPHESATDQLFFDQYTGKLNGTNLYKNRNLGSRVRATFKPVHTGSIFGWPSKVIAFITCLLGVSFPATGIIMWINRISRKPKKTFSKKAAVVLDN